MFTAAYFRELFIQLDVRQAALRVPDFNLWVAPRELFTRSLYIRNAKCVTLLSLPFLLGIIKISRH